MNDFNMNEYKVTISERIDEGGYYGLELLYAYNRWHYPSAYSEVNVTVLPVLLCLNEMVSFIQSMSEILRLIKSHERMPQVNPTSTIAASLRDISPLLITSIIRLNSSSVRVDIIRLNRGARTPAIASSKSSLFRYLKINLSSHRIPLCRSGFELAR